MAKNKKHKQPSKPAPPVRQTPTEPTSSARELEVAADLQVVHAQAITAAGEARPESPEEPRLESVDLDRMWAMACEARDAFQVAERLQADALRRCEERTLELGRRASELSQRKVELDHHEAATKDRARSLDRRESELSQREVGFLTRDAELRARELNAEAGFGHERRAMLRSLDDERELLRASLRELEQEIAERRRAAHEHERADRESHRAALDEQSRVARAELARDRAALDTERIEHQRALTEHEQRLESEQRDLAKHKRRLEYDTQDLEEMRADLDSRVEQRSAAVKQELEHQLRICGEQLEQARRDRDAHADKLRQREECDRRFGQRTPEQVLAELDKLRVDNDHLRASLAERPDAAATARLQVLEHERHDWQAERGELQRKASEFQRRLARVDADVREREVQRDVIKTLESQRALLAEAHQQLRTEVDDLLSRSTAVSPFPACQAMDADRELQSSTPTFNGIRDLKTFVEDLRHRIASEQLFYSDADLRSFLGGLAMSRLLLLQGISGTGKTSLPLAFARALGGGATVIEVQAGWRDPQDLVGHYNVFEKRFYEGEFLKALYRARTPRWNDAIHIVVLDEMNLSHPEQYFSGLLSALERNPEDRYLGLMSHALERAPALFHEGSKLSIPTNVWFVGTANHDETTKDFADKTYDRAHVMELPHRPEPFTVDTRSPRPPVSFKALDAAFERAFTQHSPVAKRAIDFLERELRKPLARDFEIGWGPRLERQLNRYLPVVVAAGGSIGEATDHMLATRLLRKLANRHDSRPERLEELRERIQSSWSALDADHVPVRSLDALTLELERKGVGERA